MQVALNNSGESYRAVLFTLALPTGIGVVKDEFGEAVVIADAALSAAGYGVTSNQLTDGNYRFAVVSTSGNESIPAECGPLFTFTIEAEPTLTTETEFAATLSEIKLTDAWAVDHDAENVIFSITTNDGRVILDENAETTPEASDGEVNVLVKRIIKANEWSTICLPFEMSEEQLKDAFGNDVQLAEFIDYDMDDEENIIINFELLVLYRPNEDEGLPRLFLATGCAFRRAAGRGPHQLQLQRGHGHQCH